MTDCEKAEQIVYISCVDEVRYSFVSHLSEAIRRKGINDVFEDSDDLLSEEAQAKVERARVSVMVLPGNRKPSTALACLGKLRKVLECQRNDDQVVVPVLYGVGIVEGEWLNELKEIAGLSPVQSRRRKYCTDSELVEEIARVVLHKLYHIGIYSKLLEINKMVCNQPFGIRSVGIWGMPGIGKTTLAKAVFVQMSGEFDACCFIKDFDNVIHKKGLYRLLEEQFLEEDGGTITKLSLLRDKLNNKKVLVVLDDVHNHLAAKSFLGGFDWFGPESLIIITSRDKQVFRLCQVDQIYEVHGLNEKEALQLFSLCASINNMAEQNLDELSMEVIKYANGNPLALNIYGSKLKGKKKLLEMETAFLELKRRPPPEIVDVVKSSYDTLSDSEKNIFLDIACFFQGENVDYVTQLLEGCGFFPHDGIDVLVEKCMVTVSENRVRMHNLIQDFGREIINGVTVQIKGRNRLWEPWRIKYLLEENEHKANVEPKTTTEHAQGIEEIEGMFLDTSNLSFDIKPSAFVNMLNLRLLKIYCSSPEIHPGINFPEGFLYSLPNELRLLHWENCPLQILPQNFDPVHLVEINMPYSQLQKLWDGSKNLEMLRTIRLCHSQQLVDIGDLLNAPNLEVIDLQGCTRLQSFPATDQLLHLRVVNLSGCTKIESFPKIPPNTETLHLQGTGITELPLSIVKPNYIELLNLLNDIPGLSGVSNLEQNDLERLTSLIKMSSSSQDLGKLICLDLKDCSRLRSLPNMVSLEFLKVLDLSGCSELETIQGFPPNLKELYIAGTAVREVPQLPQSLELLNAHGCISLESIPFNSENLPMHYIFSNCFNLSPQVVNDFLVKVLGNVKHIPRELLHELNETPAFSFCAPSHANQDSTLDLQPGSSVMTRLNPSWRNTLVGFAMLVEVSFSEDYSDATGLGISCVCRWKNKEGHSHKIERNLHCRAAGKAAPRVQKDHIFVLCDVKMRPCTDEGNYPDMWADLVVFEFFPVKQQTKRLDDSCTVTRCGVYAITGNTDLKMSSPVLSLDPMEVSGNEVEEVLRVRYDGLEEMDKALFLYIACLFNDEDADLVAPLIGSIDLDVSLGLNVLANSSLIRVSSNGEIVMHCLLRNMGKEILHRESVFPGSSEDLTRDFEKDSVASFSSRNWKYDVYLSFRGEDVRRGFLSHIHKEFQRKGITPFIDNEIKRGRSIGPELLQAIRGSKIAIILFSRNYGSLKWCLDELVEIMKCREELGQTVMNIFYDVDPSDVRKQRGDFGKAFRKTCVGRPEEVKQKWQQALTSAANILGEDSRNWENEAEMIIKISKDVSDVLSFTPSTDFDEFVGIEAHVTEVYSLLRLDLDEVRMIGIWGPAGIGKSTISRVLYNQLFHKFQLSAIMDNIKVRYPRPCHDEYSAKLQLQKELLSQMINQKDMVIPHLGVAQERLKDKKVLLVLDDVDELVQLEAMAKDIRWFGLGSRIIVVTQDLRLLKAHGIKYIYKVDFPPSDEALQIFMYAFGQKSPKVGFEEISRTVTELAGKLPLALPRLMTSLDGDIESILKFSYNSLNEEEKDLFLHIVCFFTRERIETLEEFLATKFVDVRYGLQILADKSLISMNMGNIQLHNLQKQLGREIVRHEPGQQSICEPGKRKFLVDARDICEVLTDDTGTRTLIGIDLELTGEIEDEINISDRAFERMSNLQYLRFRYPYDRCHEILHLPQGLSYISRKLRLLHWERFPLTCLPSKFNPKLLVKINMRNSMLEKLWEGIEPIRDLKWMDLSSCVNLKELPDLSTATKLQELRLRDCLSLVELPSSIGNATNLLELDLVDCSSLVELPSSIGNLRNLKKLYLNRCSSLAKLPSSIGNFTRLKELDLDGCSSLLEIPYSIGNNTNLGKLYASGCSSLVELPSSIGNITNLRELYLFNCSSLVEFPSSIANLTSLEDLNLSGCSSLVELPSIGNGINLRTLSLSECSNLVELPSSIENATNLQELYLNDCSSLLELPSSIWSIINLQALYLNGCSSLMELPSVVGNAINLQSLSLMNCSSMVELPSSIWNATNLSYLDASGCSSLVELNLKLELNQFALHPVLPDSLSSIDEGNCESLVERLDCSFHNPDIILNFANCFKLNKEARDLIFQTSACTKAILPGGQVPACFTYRAIGDSLTVKLNQRYLPTSLRFKACLLLVEGQNKWPHWELMKATSGIMDTPNGHIVMYRPSSHLQGPLLMENLYTFEFVVEPTSSEFVLEFEVDHYKCAVGECGLVQLF